MSLQTTIRIALGYLALASISIGVWALLAPKSFFDDYPGLGRVWVGVDGPYNEHLVRDVGALNLALSVVLVAAGVTLLRPLVVTAAIACLVWGVPHVVYHIFNAGELDAGDAAASIVGLALFAVLPIVLIFVAGALDDGAPDATSGDGSEAVAPGA